MKDNEYKNPNEEYGRDLEDKLSWIGFDDADEIKRCIDAYGPEYVDATDLIEAGAIGSQECIKVMLPHISYGEYESLADDEYSGMSADEHEGMTGREAMDPYSRLFIDSYYDRIQFNQAFPKVQPPQQGQEKTRGRYL